MFGTESARTNSKIFRPINRLRQLLGCDERIDWVPSLRYTWVKMYRSFSPLVIGLLFAAATAPVTAQICPCQGIYEGKELIRVNGQAPAYFPTRLTVLLDGHSIIETSEITGRLSAVALI